MSARTLRTTHVRVTPSQLCIGTTSVQGLPARRLRCLNVRWWETVRDNASAPSYRVQRACIVISPPYSPIRTTSLVLLTHQEMLKREIALSATPPGACPRMHCVHKGRCGIPVPQSRDRMTPLWSGRVAIVGSSTQPRGATSNTETDWDLSRFMPKRTRACAMNDGLRAVFLAVE